MIKYLKNTKVEDESEESGRIAQQTSRKRSAETEKLTRVLSVPTEERISGRGRNALKAALESGLELSKEQALDILGKLIRDLRDFADPTGNVHKPIKNQLMSIEGVLEELQKMEAQEQGEHKKTSPLRSPVKRTSPPPPRTNDVTTDTNTEMELETDADTESTAQDNREVRKAKRKIRSPEDGTVRTTKKLRDFGPSFLSQKKETTEQPQNSGKQAQKHDWETVQPKKNKRKERKKKPSKNPPVPQPKPNPKKPRRAAMRPEALIIRPADKSKYSDILKQIKMSVPADQVCDTVDKIRRTAARDMLITLSKGSSDRGKVLQTAISRILKDDAKVIATGPEEDLEIRNIDDTTITEDILAALQKVAGNDCGITAEAIKVRKAFRGIQIALVTLAAPTAQKVVGESGKIRIGWVNCRIKTVLRPVRCYKCWHFGHSAVQCQSGKDRSKLCIKCGEEGHKLTECKKPAKCALCADHPGVENVAHLAGSNRCPVYQEALKKIAKNRK